MTTLQSMTLDIATYLSRPVRSTATGGSTTTLIDTSGVVNEPADYFATGVIWFLTGNNAGKSSPITTWNNTTKTFTFPTMAGACAANDRYAAGNLDYPRWKLQDSVNQALKRMGEVLKTDITLTTVANQQAYTLPAGVNDVKRVEVATFTAEPYGWIPHFNWDTINGKIEFVNDSQPDTAGYKIRLWYYGDHAELTGDTDAIDASLHPERVKWNAIVDALRWRIALRGGEDPLLAQLYAEATLMAAKADLDYPIIRMPRDPKHAFWAPYGDWNWRTV